MDVKTDGDSIQWGSEQWCPEHITTGVAAQFCGVGEVTVLRWIQRGYLTAFRLPDGHYTGFAARISPASCWSTVCRLPVQGQLMDTKEVAGVADIEPDGSVRRRIVEIVTGGG